MCFYQGGGWIQSTATIFLYTQESWQILAGMGWGYPLILVHRNCHMVTYMLIILSWSKLRKFPSLVYEYVGTRRPWLMINWLSVDRYALFN